MTSDIQTGAQFTISLPKNSEIKAGRFPPINIRDNGVVRLGGQGPIFRPTAIANAGKVRLDVAPSFTQS